MFPTPAFVDRLRAGLGRDLTAFAPELVVAVGVVGLLLLRMLVRPARFHVGVAAVGVALLALGSAVGQAVENPPPTAHFDGLTVLDPFACYVRVVLLACAALTLILGLLTGIPDRDDAADFSVLLLGSTLGMMLMATANHLLTAFLAVEMASVPSYALAGFLKGRRQGSEAALKYVIYGAAASGVMLYGISLLCAASGTGSLPLLSERRR